MVEIGQNVFWSLVAELLFIFLAILLKDNKRRMAGVLAIGTLFAGIIGFGQPIYLFFSENVFSLSRLLSPNLVINGVSYSMPDPDSTHYCVAQEFHTGNTDYQNNIEVYDVVVPHGWVMMWDFYQAKWDNGVYDSDGLLIITGPFSGRIQINTGGSCSGPIEWYKFIYKNRVDAYPVPLRLEHKIP